MADIDTRTVELGRYFTDAEDQHTSEVCLIGEPRGTGVFSRRATRWASRSRRATRSSPCSARSTSIGSVLGQDQDNFVVIPLRTYLKFRGQRNSLTLHVKAEGSEQIFQHGAGRCAKDSARSPPRGRGQRRRLLHRHRGQLHLALAGISSAFFAVFLMVSSISAVVGGIVIMNVMLVSVTERTKEIGVRRAVGATQADVLRQFLMESVLQCILGGAIGISDRIPVRARAAGVHGLPGIGADLGGAPGCVSEFGHRVVLRNLSGGEGVEAGSGGGAAGGVMP